MEWAFPQNIFQLGALGKLSEWWKIHGSPLKNNDLEEKISTRQEEKWKNWHVESKQKRFGETTFLRGNLEDTKFLNLKFISTNMEKMYCQQ